MNTIKNIIEHSLPAGRRGFTIFFAMLVSSLALAVGLAIFDLTVRELELSSTATQSQYAIYAADTGIDCALYWDSKCPTSGGPTYCTKSGGSAFATSSASGQPPTPSNLLCNSQDITSAWTVTTGGSLATTTFTMSVSAISQVSGTTTCATIDVGKFTNAGVLYTTIVSHGFNTCTTGITRVERTLQVTY